MKSNTMEKRLEEALFRLSFGKFSRPEARKLAKTIAPNIDLNNEMLAHKGVNWYAKQVLKSL